MGCVNYVTKIEFDLLLSNIDKDIKQLEQEIREDCLRQGIDPEAILSGDHSGVIYDATLRDTLPTGSKSEISGEKEGHTTQWYDDDYHVSWENPDQTNVHWTDQEIRDRNDPDRHEPPTDAKRGNDPRK